MSIGDRSAPGTEEPVTTATEAPDREAGLSEEAGEPDQPATAPSAKRRWMRSNTALAGGCLLVAALTVALILSLLALTNQDAQAGARTSALTAARTYAVQLASYDYRNLDRNFAIVAGESTPSFRRSFTESSDALKATLAKYKATAGATVVSAGLVSSGTSQAVALVFLTQKIANATQTQADHRSEPGADQPGEVGGTVADQPGHLALTVTRSFRRVLGVDVWPIGPAGKSNGRSVVVGDRPAYADDSQRGTGG